MEPIWPNWQKTDQPTAPSSMVVRPSLLAAVDTGARVAGVVLLFLLPFIVGGAASGDGKVFVGVLGGGLFLDLVPGIVAATLPAIRLAFTRYELDAEGIRVRMDVIARSDKRVPWAKVTLLRHRRTLLDRILGIERLDVVAYGERGTVLHLVGLRDAAALRDRVALGMRKSASVDALFAND